MNGEFFKAFKDCTSGAWMECGCGKFHFDFNYQYDDETHDEIDRLQKQMEESPDAYQSHDGMIKAVVITGIEYVPDCTCRTIEQIQEIIDKNAINIAKYLRLRSQKLKEFADAINVDCN